MKSSIERLQLEGKIILIAGNTGELAAFTRGHKHGSFPPVRVLIGINNRSSNFLRRTIQTVGREVGSNKSTRPVDHVTFRAARLSEEKQFPLLRVARNRSSFPSTLQNSQVSHHSLDLRYAQRTERGHPCRRDSRPQDVQSFVVGELLNCRARGDVWPTFTASPIQPVAGCANRFKRFPSILSGRMALMTIIGRGFRILRASM